MQRHPSKLESRHVGWAMLIALIGLINTFIVIAPAITTGYSWDDNVVSTLRGAGRNLGIDLPGLMVSGVRELFSNQGRFFPLASISAVPLYYFDRFAYKLSIVVLVLVNVVLSGRLGAKIARDEWAFPLFLAVSPIVFQMRFGPDALQGYHWLLQLVYLWTALSLLFFVRYLETKRTGTFFVSLIFFEVALLTYEVTYVFFILFAFLAVALRAESDSWRSVVISSVPFLGLTIITACGVIMARKVAGFPLLGVNGAYIPNHDIRAFAGALIRHCTATLPTSYTTLSAVRETEKLDPFAIWTAVQRFTFKSGWLVASEAAVIWLYFWVRPRNVEKRGRIALALFGSLFLILPSVLIATSPKYQAHNWIDWGMSYLPVYLSFFGVASLLTGLFAAVPDRLGRAPLTPLLGCLVGGIALWTNTSNRKVAENINAVFRYPREFAEQALQNGLFATVPSGSYLIVATEAYPGANPAFFRTHVDVSLRNVVGAGHYLGSRVSDPSYFAKIFLSTRLQDVPISPSARLAPEDEVASFTFSAQDAVYFFTYQQISKTAGYSLLGRLVNLSASESLLQKAEADEVFVNLSPHWPDTADLQVPTLEKNARLIHLPTEQKPIHSSRLGRLFHVALPPNETVNLLRIQQLPVSR